MTIIFYSLVLASFGEAIMQLGWVECYFVYGIPVLSIDVNLKDPDEITKYALRDGKKGVMIRQKDFSAARYVFHHAFATKAHDNIFRLIFFSDLKFILFVVFLISVPVGFGVTSIGSGVVLSLVVVRVVAQHEKKNIASSSINT